MALQLLLITACLTHLSLGFPTSFGVDALRYGVVAETTLIFRPSPRVNVTCCLGFSWLTGITTVWSGWEYFGGKGNVGVRFHNTKSLTDMLRGRTKPVDDDNAKPSK
jgi:hypothetical protein